MLGSRAIKCIWKCLKHLFSTGSLSARTPPEAQTVARLRRFLLDPGSLGIGLGRHLIEESLAFCKAGGYDSVILWTISLLTMAAQLYRAVGFRKMIEKPGRMGGVEVIEEMYELNPIP